MQFIRANLSDLPAMTTATVVTVGNFDGLHRGHLQLITEAVKYSQQSQLPSVVMSFRPYPKEFFLKGQVPRLMEWREKFQALQDAKIDYFIQWRFDTALAALSAEQFIQVILVKCLKAKLVIVGDDFQFGANRQGDDALLIREGKRLGFQVIKLATLFHEGERISSTRIRHTLQAGNMTLAKHLLGRYYHLCGTVCHGDKLGRQLGFPTANIALHRRLVPLSGVFVVLVEGIDQHTYQGVANIGSRPAVDGKTVLLEVFIFDFNREIYGAHITVSFLHKLRDEENYPSLEALKEQIAQDVADAKAYFVSQ